MAFNVYGKLPGYYDISRKRQLCVNLESNRGCAKGLLFQNINLLTPVFLLMYSQIQILPFSILVSLVGFWLRWSLEHLSRIWDQPKQVSYLICHLRLHYDTKVKQSSITKIPLDYVYVWRFWLESKNSYFWTDILTVHCFL